MFKTVNAHEERLSDEEITAQLRTIQEELDHLQKEGEERFKLNKLYSTNFEIDRSYQITQLIQNMQNTVMGFLSSDEFKETTIGSEIDEIMKSNQNVNINSAIAKALSEIAEYSVMKNKLSEDPDNDIDFQFLLETKDSDVKFTEEFCDLEENIANIEKKVGRPDIQKVPCVKTMLERIIDSISKLNMKEIDKSKNHAVLLQKEFQGINSIISGHNAINRSMSTTEINSDGSIKVIGVDSGYNRSV